MNDARTLYQGFIMRGVNKENAFFAIIDHFVEMNLHDRNRLNEEIKRLKSRIAKLESQDE
jgi:hypothetical protein